MFLDSLQVKITGTPSIFLQRENHTTGENLTGWGQFGVNFRKWVKVRIGVLGLAFRNRVGVRR